MSANQFVSVAGSGKQELRTAISTSGGAGDASKIVQTDAAGKLDSTLMPAGLGVDTEVMATSENLTAGQFVNIYVLSGVRTARLADSNNSRVAHGFVLTATTSPANATVYKSGTNTQFTGLTPGEEQFLGTAGARTTAPEIASPAQIIQSLGYSSDETEVVFTFQSPTLIV